MSVKSDSEFDHEICNDRIRPVAEALVAKYEELRHVDPSKVLFVVNHRSSGNKKQMVLARTRKIPSKWADILYQLGSHSYSHIIEFYAKTTEEMDESQMVALVYRELRRIGPEGEILIPDVHDWWQILMGLGRKWFYPDSTCPNLLDDNVDWKRLMGRYYEELEPYE